jgi:hypothetical protein
LPEPQLGSHGIEGLLLGNGRTPMFTIIRIRCSVIFLLRRGDFGFGVRVINLFLGTGKPRSCCLPATQIRGNENHVQAIRGLWDWF